MSPKRVLTRLDLAKFNQAGGISSLLTAGVVTVALIGIFMTAHSHASNSADAIKSGVSGNCLDIQNDQLKPGVPVDAWGCNDSNAQDWTIMSGKIVHSGNYCLSVANDDQSAGSQVVINSCSQASGQVWLKDGTTLMNPNSGLCLSLPSSQTGEPLVLAGCSASASDSWRATDNDQSGDCQTGSKSQQIACTAEKQFSIWQSGTTSHHQLLNKYTDGAPYEEWCADFVSYVYKQAGYPFSGGETDGWDENNANNIQNMGFTIHYPSSYTPQPGDVGYFSYSGGHVEIVVSGGKNPTFIYGNSATIDPTTGNGQMMANTKTSDGEFGQLVYYLSPS